MPDDRFGIEPADSYDLVDLEPPADGSHLELVASFPAHIRGGRMLSQGDWSFMLVVPYQHRQAAMQLGVDHVGVMLDVEVRRRRRKRRRRDKERSDGR